VDIHIDTHAPLEPCLDSFSIYIIDPSGAALLAGGIAWTTDGAAAIAIDRFMGRRPPCCDKEGVKKGPWTPEEDLVLVFYVQEHGPGNWRAVPANTSGCGWAH